MKKWFVAGMLAVAQFVMVLDSTVMNVSISRVAADLHTTISGMQAAITFYTLTMAALMLTGGKLGDKWGKLKAFKIGAVVYGVGSLTTALSPSLAVLLAGWSVVEGLGAVLVIPAIAALVAVNYKGRDRVTAFAILGAATGLAAAVGPIVGGMVTTFFSWRYVFAAETVIVAIIFLFSSKMSDEPPKNTVKLDIASSILSAAGMAILVFGVLQSKTWGWIRPLDSPTLNGHDIAPFGISLTAYFILLGIVILKLFISRQRTLMRTGRTPLLNVDMLSIPVLRSGLTTLMGQYFVLAALSFVIPVYLQTVLGYNSLHSGLKLIPLSIGLVLFSAIGSRLAVSKSAKYISRIGQVGLALGTFVIMASISADLKGVMFWIGLFVVGLGFGLLASQLGNVNMSAVSAKETAEVGGLQGTFQNLGSSFGTAIVGSVFLLALTAGFTSAVQSSSLPAQTKSAITAQTSQGVQIVSQSQVQQSVIAHGGSQQAATQISGLYQQSQIKSLKEAMFIIFVISLLALLFSRDLPKNVLTEKSASS